MGRSYPEVTPLGRDPKGGGAPGPCGYTTSDDAYRMALLGRGAEDDC